jgi:hypothetical protein
MIKIIIRGIIIALQMIKIITWGDNPRLSDDKNHHYGGDNPCLSDDKNHRAGASSAPALPCQRSETVISGR